MLFKRETIDSSSNLFAPVCWRHRTARNTNFWNLSSQFLALYPQHEQNVLPSCLPWVHTCSPFSGTGRPPSPALLLLSPLDPGGQSRSFLLSVLKCALVPSFSPSALFYATFSREHEIPRLICNVFLRWLLSFSAMEKSPPLPFPSCLLEVLSWHLCLFWNPLEHLCSFSPSWFLKIQYAYSGVLSFCSGKYCWNRHKVTSYLICQNHSGSCSKGRSWNSLDNLILSIAFISCRLLNESKQ